MDMKINLNYKKIITMIFFILISAIPLILIENNIFLFFTYFVSYGGFLILIGSKMTKEDNLYLSILMLLFYSYIIEILIHYMNLNVFLEIEYLYFIPLSMSFFKAFKKNNQSFFMFIIVFLINFFIGMLNMCEISFWVKSVLPIWSFILFYYSIKNTEINIVDIYKFIFCICIVLTVIQTIVGFNRDTRNGVFGVFGLNAYAFFVLCYSSYMLFQFLNGNKSLKEFLLSIITSGLIFLCTENKASICLLIVIIGFLILLYNKITFKKIFLVILIPIVAIILYFMLMKLYPFFSYMNNYQAVYNYFFDNNDKVNFKYGRFESLKIVYEDLDVLTKTTGLGAGASTPLDKVFYQESDRENYVPLYIYKYGSNHGFQLTSLATIILDYGMIVFFIILLIFIKKFISIIKKITLNQNNKVTAIDFVQFAMCITTIFYFSYNNIIVNFRTLSLLGILFAIKKIDSQGRIVCHE